MNRKLLVALAACCLASGMMPAQARSKPRAPKAPPAEDYQKAKAICDEVALQTAHGVTQKPMADTNVYRAYDECMAKHGFPKKS